MNPHISAVTIGVQDIDRSRRFYSELGCEIDQDHGVFVSFKLGDGSSGLALYNWAALAADAGVESEGSGFRGFTLSYIAPSSEVVDDVMQRARSAGATIVKPAQKSKWGGYSGHFSDPDGHLWKVVSET